MISQERLWERLKTLTKSGTSGYFTQDEYNSNIYSVQYAILSLLCDNYENNQKVSDALINHVVETGQLTSLTGGVLFAVDVITTLEDYYRTLDLKFINGSDEYPSRKISVNEETMYLTSPIRKPDITKHKTNYLFKSGNIITLPKTTGNKYVLTYCKKPAEAKIAFTTASDANNDYLVIDEANTIDIDFPEGLFNLFTYYMLESMGIEQKENLAQSYAELGINRETQLQTK